ncbi:FAD-dependent oxidoreductase [Parafrankia sp. FMc2]|uniref:FAD-dependent oxidoreductase n=1 Tax=Parafrankia sp. FMc2 TaxID=3233196 RepID=UPI0034D66D7B
MTQNGRAILAAGPTVVTPDDPRYGLFTSGENHRYVANPERIVLATSSEQVEKAVGAAVAAGKRIAVQAGGHCGEAFVSNPEIDVIVDVSLMTDVGFDADRNAFFIEPGATLGHLYGALYKRWGVTIPGGTCMSVAAGGHICGGGFGPLSRLLGLTVDYLYAVEVVVVDGGGTARTVLATREPDDPNHDLWWAHTGGGGGNFGVVTRYWMRIPEGVGTDPAKLLPRPPATLLILQMSWPWEHLTEDAFTRLVRNFLTWHLANGAVDSPGLGLYAYLECFHRSTADVTLTVQVAADQVDADERLDAFLAVMGDGVGVTPAVRRRQRLPWLTASWYLTPPDSGPGAIAVRRKVKSADLRGPHTDEQLATVYRHLTGPALNGLAYIEYMGYGGRVNAVPPEATARVQRSTAVKTFYNMMWVDPADDERHIRWLREMYREVHVTTGGVPVPGGVNTGAYINYPDIDLADPAWNTSGVPWHTLYYGDNYPRLQRIKSTWDPGDVFRHTLSIRPA